MVDAATGREGMVMVMGKFLGGLVGSAILGSALGAITGIAWFAIRMVDGRPMRLWAAIATCAVLWTAFFWILEVLYALGRLYNWSEKEKERRP